MGQWVTEPMGKSFIYSLIDSPQFPGRQFNPQTIHLFTYWPIDFISDSSVQVLKKINRELLIPGSVAGKQESSKIWSVKGEKNILQVN